MALLNQLLAILQSDGSRGKLSREVIARPLGNNNPWDITKPSLAIAPVFQDSETPHRAGPLPRPEPDTWFDRVSMSMGMLEEPSPI